MATSNKKVGKKKAAPKNKTGASLPQSSSIPAGMKQMGGGYAPTWTPEEIGDSIHGVVSDLPKELTINKGKKNENETRVMEVTDMEGERFAVWQSAVLTPLFDEIEELGDDGIGTEIFIEYNGLGKKKPGQNAPRLYTVAVAE